MFFHSLLLKFLSDASNWKKTVARFEVHGAQDVIFIFANTIKKKKMCIPEMSINKYKKSEGNISFLCKKKQKKKS